MALRHRPSPFAGRGQRADDGPLRQLDLERVGGPGDRGRQLGGGRGGEAGALAGWPSRLASARRARHGLVPTPPSASRTSAIVPSSTRIAAADRDQRELVRLAVAELQVGGLAGDRARPAPRSPRSARRARADAPAPGCPRGAGRSRRSRWPARRAARACARPRPARPGPPRRRRGGWRCTWSLVPRIAWPRLKPSSAAQPLPGSRLLHGDIAVAEVAAADPLAEVAAHGGHVPQLRPRRPAAAPAR